MIRNVLIILSMLYVGQVASLETDKVVRVLDFEVFLDDREVGRHTFKLLEKGDSIQVSSSMALDFKLFKIKRVKYRHQADEVWESGCLVSLQSETEKQGKAFAVDASTDQTGLVVQRAKEIETLDGCVRGFSYWNPEWLQGAYLLNAESGINVPVEINSRISAQDSITHIALTLPNADINLQYDDAGEWLSLQTELLIGGTLRYQRVF
jgi:hypothetical protein